MASTANDVLRFFVATMKQEIISGESFKLMTTVGTEQNSADEYPVNFGSGLFRYGDVFRGAFGHLGLFVGSEAIALFKPDKDMVFVLLANVSRIKDPDALVRSYLAILETYPDN